MLMPEVRLEPTLLALFIMILLYYFETKQVSYANAGGRTRTNIVGFIYNDTFISLRNQTS